jgi:hypothetical protein
VIADIVTESSQCEGLAELMGFVCRVINLGDADGIVEDSNGMLMVVRLVEDFGAGNHELQNGVEVSSSCEGGHAVCQVIGSGLGIELERRRGRHVANALKVD